MQFETSIEFYKQMKLEIFNILEEFSYRPDIMSD